ncbi:hypothetical protein SAMN04487926_10311 [Paraburkholderia steynii]|uniref:Uncharacterized protein n=1 Tax=Paraburkholderia steynii TaxID=1245441 RepID=A0A7Z7FGZ6_9BURK|nr:hypothetical protein [Paraburkholderia steynii]SDH23787.1 hypothetical protein SAMN04487926_10311 [Paraburkholderia steynii]
MKPLPTPLFDVYALSLPRGHGFGNCPPVEAWQTEDGLAFGVVTRDVNDGSIGVLALRRREDDVWSIVCREHGLGTVTGAVALLKSAMKEGMPREPIPAGTARRPALWDLQRRSPGSIFNLLSQPSHHVAAWLINQVYLALPNPDKNWTGDFQTSNFHTRLWEAHLLACFREQGILVTQPWPSPDFRIENRHGGVAWVEAVTTNPPTPYDHANAKPTTPPRDQHERSFGPAAVRFAKTLRNKLERHYDLLDHVAGQPFAIALADFHAPGSMVWSREALIAYLYGTGVDVTERDGKRVATAADIKYLLSDPPIPAGLFRTDENAALSAVIFTNTCSISKFNRVGISAGAQANGLRYVRVGEFYDRTPGALKGIPFCLDIISEKYRTLWPHGYEPWSADLEVFHNPHATNPLPRTLLPEVTHWFDAGGEIICESHYETSILWSRTLIRNMSDPIPTLSDFLGQGPPVAK